MEEKTNIIIRIIKWLYPGMRVKRWIGLIVLGVVLMTFGSARFIAESSFFYRALDILCIVTGLFLSIVGLRNTLGSLVTIFLPPGERDLVDIISLFYG